MYFNKKSEGIDFDFYESNLNNNMSVSDRNFEDINEGIKKINIKPLRNDSFENYNSHIDSEQNINDLNRVVDKDYYCGLSKCIAYENNSTDGQEVEHVRKSRIEEESEISVISPLPDSSLCASSPSSDLTNITPFSTCSSCSSFKDKNSYDDEDEKLDMKLLSDAVKTLSLRKKTNLSPTHSTKRLSKRKNMTFSNEELRRIDRENERLLKKIMSYTKPRPKSIATRSNTPPLNVKASAAINRSKQQRQINHDNYILLKRIHNAKPTQSFSNRSQL